MKMKFERWIIYTVLVAALPILIRLFSFVILKSPVGQAVSPIDIVFFGLTLNIANINELNELKFKNKNNKSAILPNKDKILGLSIFLIVFLAITLGMIYSSELMGIKSISLVSTYICSIILSIASLIFSWNVVLKIQRYYEHN